MELDCDSIGIDGMGGFCAAVPVSFCVSSLPVGEIVVVKGVAQARSGRSVLANMGYSNLFLCAIYPIRAQGRWWRGKVVPFLKCGFRISNNHSIRVGQVK